MDTVIAPQEAVIEHTETYLKAAKASFGFWVYLMTDCVLFASLFAVYSVLHTNTNGGPAGYQLFDLPYVLIETIFLLTSSFTSGLATLSIRLGRKIATTAWLVLTGLLGLSFLIMELHEFRALVQAGHSWRQSGFLSGYFTLVGTHGLHITVGLIWLACLLVWLLRSKKISPKLIRQLNLFSMFWHFLDVVWIFIFTIVYLLGVVWH